MNAEIYLTSHVSKCKYLCICSPYCAAITLDELDYMYFSFFLMYITFCHDHMKTEIFLPRKYSNSEGCESRQLQKGVGCSSII